MKQNGVIIYLTCKKDLWVFVHSLRMLYVNYNKQFSYPVVVFHDDLTKMDIAGIYNHLIGVLGYMPQNLSFEQISFTLPSHISTNPEMYNPSLDKYRLGYRFMCDLFAGKIYNHPALTKYDWCMRLDSDSFLISPINYDMFERMSNEGKEYAFMSECDFDNPETCAGFHETTQKYIQDSGITPTQLNQKLKDGVWDYSVYYTNFFAGKMSFFRGKQYQDYYEHLNSTGNIFYKRWGDHDIQWFAVNMFLKEDQVWCVKDIAYQHGSWVKNKEYVDAKSIEMIPDIYKKWVV